MTLPAGWKIDPEEVERAYREKGLRPKRGTPRGRCMCALDALDFINGEWRCSALSDDFVDGFTSGFDNVPPLVVSFSADYATGYANGQAVAQHVGATLGWQE